MIFAGYSAVCQTPSFHLECENKVIFPLSRFAGFHATYLQRWKEGHNEYLALGYRSRPRIYIYDYQSQNLIDSIFFDFEGINGAGADMGGFHFYSLDKFVIHLYHEQELAFFDRRPLRCTDRVALVNFNASGKIDSSLIIDPSTFAPILPVSDALYFAGSLLYQFRNRKMRPLVSYNPKLRKKVSLGPILRIAENRFYYDRFRSSYDALDSNGKFILSYSISDSIYVVESDTETAYLAKSKYIYNIPYLIAKEDMKTYTSYTKSELLAVWTSSHYYGVKYDPYRKLIYRFVIRDFKPDEMPFNMPDYSMIILDTDFSFLAEIELPEDVEPSLFYLTENGLYFADRSEYRLNSDFITFNEYTITIR